ncbi:MAG TPA: response regulator [Polyangiaceae bacterium]|nr:response regulator [Polyangiaceae bacterium]
MKAPAASTAAGSRPRILCVDDEPRVLQGLRQVLFRSFEITAAAGGEAGLAALESQHFEAVVSDMQMPQMNGATFLTEVRKRRPDVSRILLTGHADIESAIAAVNRGQIFRFLTKPCPPEELIAALTDAVAQHRLITSERVLLEQTLVGSIRALSEVLALVHPEVFGPTARQHARVCAVAERLHVLEAWQVEVASMLLAVGYVVLPTDVAAKLRSGIELGAGEREMTSQMSGVVERVLSHIPRLEAVRELLHWHELLLATPQLNEDAPLGAQVLFAVTELGLHEGREGGAIPAIRCLRSSGRHATRVVEALAAVCQPRAPRLEPLPIDRIESGMTLAADVMSKSGLLVMAHGQLVSEALLQRLRNFHARLGVVQPILCELPPEPERQFADLAVAG